MDPNILVNAVTIYQLLHVSLLIGHRTCDHCVVALIKLFTPVCLCRQAV